MVGIIDWRLEELERLGVTIHYNVFAGGDDVLAFEPDLVVVATGGIPQSPALDAGDELVTSTWDILAGSTKPGDTVLLFDDNGAHPGMSAAEVIAGAGAELELVSPERFFAPEIGGMNHVPYAESFQQHGVRITIARRMTAVKRAGNRLEAVIGSDFGDYVETREVDQVVVEHGTVPNAELYEALRPGSVNHGEVDYKALIAGKPQTVTRNPEGRYRLIRIGDAVSSRNIHAAVYDALRFAKDF
jgi:pyruvate/2-oxoglutarate dehydrogenase complex dihydrolipoamide dehydrogenase (E3) component